uniref:Protein kinase domain-containing protein n=1 Tax=Meloidogyne incognita TaxID=6306 RepID=A0A914NDH5_MELIC
MRKNIFVLIFIIVYFVNSSNSVRKKRIEKFLSKKLGCMRDANYWKDVERKTNKASTSIERELSPEIQEQSESEESVIVNTSSDEGKCYCKKYTLEELNEKIDIKNISLIYKKDEKEGEGGFGRVYHAYWPKNNICVALKVSNLKMGGTKQKHKLSRKMIENEVKILKHFSKLEKEKRKYIIYMYESQEKIIDGEPKMFFVLELGGESLIDYFNRKMKKALETHTPQEMRIIAYNLIIKISMCAAKALQHFHKYGIHLDIKSSNFVTFPKHNKYEEKLKEKENDSIEDDQLECKIIDFNTSVLLPAEDAVAIKWYANGTRLYKAPEIRQTNLNENYNKQFYMTRAVDNWAFGLMIYGLWQNANRLYAEILGKEDDYDLLDIHLEKIRFEKYETQLDQIIKVLKFKNN